MARWRRGDRSAGRPPLTIVRLHTDPRPPINPNAWPIFRRATLPPVPRGYGWTPDGSIISVDSDGLIILCAFEGGCATTPINLAAINGGTIRLGGMVNES